MTLSSLGNISKLPEHDCGSPDLDEAVKTETGEGDGSCCHCCKGQNNDSDDIPCKRHELKMSASGE